MKYYRDRHGHRQDSHFQTVPCDCPSCSAAALKEPTRGADELRTGSSPDTTHHGEH